MKKKGFDLGTFFLIFFIFLFIEVIMDIFLLPADEVLIPAEIIGDAALLAMLLLVGPLSR